MAPPPGPGIPTGIPVRPGPVTAEGAKLSLILSILSFVFCGLPMGIPAVLVGRRTLRKIRQSKGQLAGEELTRAGIIMGYISSGLWLVFLVGCFALFREADKETTESEASVINMIRQINAAEADYAVIYSDSSGRFYAGSLAALGPGPGGTCAGTGTREYACLMKGPLVAPDCREPHWCILNDYKFQIQTHYSSSSLDMDYAISATPIEGRGGTKNFCSTRDGIIRSYPFFIFSLTAGYDTETCHRLTPIDKSR